MQPGNFWSKVLNRDPKACTGSPILAKCIPILSRWVRGHPFDHDALRGPLVDQPLLLGIGHDHVRVLPEGPVVSYILGPTPMQYLDGYGVGTDAFLVPVGTMLPLSSRLTNSMFGSMTLRLVLVTICTSR